MDPIAYPAPPSGLEDPDGEGVRDWVRAQNAVTEAWIGAHPGRPAIRDRLAEIWDYPRRGLPVCRGGNWFQMRNTGLQAQAVLWVAPGPDEAGRPLIDPNALSPDGTVSLAAMGIADDGSRVAWAASTAGSDWLTWRVRDVASGADLPDVLEWSKFSTASWLPDGSGFYYSALDPPDEGSELVGTNAGPRIAFHLLGTPQEDDRVVFEAADRPEWFSTAEVVDGQWLVITVERGTDPDTYVLLRRLGPDGDDLVALADGFEARDAVVAAVGPDLIVSTDRDAPRGRVVRAAPGAPPAEWQPLVAQRDDVLVEVQVRGGRLVCHWLRHARSVLTVHGLDGIEIGEVALPGVVSLAPGPLGTAVEGRADDPVVHYQVVSFLESGAVWSHDLDSGTTTRVTPSGCPLASARFVTEQVFVTSPDGTEVPMFVTGPREREPGAPVVLYGYGGFGVALTPSFSTWYAAWLERGGVVAVANLRGGGEYGREWHDAGRLANKRNVFDDFAACARWLSRQPWSGAIAINGGSNGGLLVGASVVQHPELFAAAVAEVGVFDMLRFHLYTIGWAWKADYGDPDEPEARRWLESWSPLHNVTPGESYPATLLMTGDHDDRVVPAHSYLFAAALQAAQGGSAPVLLRVSASTGHGAGKPTARLIEEAADRIAFLELALGVIR